MLKHLAISFQVCFYFQTLSSNLMLWRFVTLVPVLILFLKLCPMPFNFLWYFCVHNCLSICLSVYLPICLSICLSVSIYYGYSFYFKFLLPSLFLLPTFSFVCLFLPLLVRGGSQMHINFQHRSERVR